MISLSASDEDIYSEFPVAERKYGICCLLRVGHWLAFLLERRTLEVEQARELVR